MRSSADDASARLSGGDFDESWLHCVWNEDEMDQLSRGTGAQSSALLPEDVESDFGQASLLFGQQAILCRQESSDSTRGSKRPSPPEATADHGGEADTFGTSKRIAGDARGGSSNDDGGSGGLVQVAPPTVQPGAMVPPVNHGAASSVQPHVGRLLSSFLPCGLHGVRSDFATAPSRTVPAPTEKEDAAAAATEGEGEAAAAAMEDSMLLPSPPMSPPEHLGNYQRMPTTDSDPALPTALHPLTLRFDPPTAEAVWRAKHSQSVQRIGTYMVCSQVAIYSALGLAQANQGVQLWLLAWAIGWVPASLLLLWLREQDDGKHRANDRPIALGRDMAVPLCQAVARSRLLDWGALSLCVLPQLTLTLRTRLFEWGGTLGQLNGSDGSDGSNGLLDSSGLLDPLDGDPLGGAGALGRVLANWWFAHFQLHWNCTDPALLMLAVALSAALLSFQAPISLAPFQERLMVYKGFLGGQLSGYVFQRHLRCSYFDEQRLIGTSRAKLKTRAATAHTATRLEPTKAGAAQTATTADWTQQENRMNPFTLCFRSSALEARYRNLCFNQTARLWLATTFVTDMVFQLIDCISGQATLLESLRLVLFQAVPLIGRAIVRRRGNRRQDKERFRNLYFAWSLLLLVAKLLLPSVAGGSNVETWFFLVPFFLRLQGPRSIPLCWILSVAGVALGNISPSRSWRGDQSADAAVMRDAVVAAEIVAYTFDWQLRARFLRAQARNDAERPVPHISDR